jgi:hypothetical protein
VSWFSPPFSHILSLLGIASGLAFVVLMLFRLRVRLGLAPLYITIGVFQHMQVMLANTFYMEIFPGITVSPGSIVMFSLTFFAILLVYISDDAGEARKLCYGLLAANLATAAVSFFLSAISTHQGVTILYDLPSTFFSQDFRIMVVGTLTLILDIVLLIIVYEQSSRIFPKSIFLRIAVTMIAVLALDSIFFVTGCFWGQSNYPTMLVSSLLGKTSSAIVYSLILAVYFRFWEPKSVENIASPGEARDWQDVFHFLTFRQKYSVLKQLNEELRQSRDQLNKALGEVDWKRIDEYLIAQVGGAKQASNKPCPECAKRNYGRSLGAKDDAEIGTESSHTH